MSRFVSLFALVVSWPVLSVASPGEVLDVSLPDFSAQFGPVFLAAARIVQSSHFAADPHVMAAIILGPHFEVTRRIPSCSLLMMEDRRR